MNIYTPTQARVKFFSLIDETNNTHEPIFIKGKQNDAVIMSKEDYESIQETLYLLSIPGMHLSLKKASNELLEDCVSHEEAWK